MDEGDIQVPVGARLGEALDAELGGGLLVTGQHGLEGECDRSGAFPDYGTEGRSELSEQETRSCEKRTVECDVCGSSDPRARWPSVLARQTSAQAR